MKCICRDDLFAGDCPTECVVRWATDEPIAVQGQPSGAA